MRGRLSYSAVETYTRAMRRRDPDLIADKPHHRVRRHMRGRLNILNIRAAAFDSALAAR